MNNSGAYMLRTEKFGKHYLLRVRLQSLCKIDNRVEMIILETQNERPY